MQFPGQPGKSRASDRQRSSARDGGEGDEVADLEDAGGLQGDGLDADGPAVAVGDQGHAGRAAGLAAEGEGVRRAARRPGRVGVAGRAVRRPRPGSGRPARACARRRRGRRSRAPAPRHPGWRRAPRWWPPAGPVLGLARGVGQPVADLGERQPRLVAPVAEAAGARVVDAEQADAAGAGEGLAVEHGPAALGEVAAHERAVVVVAGDPEAVVVLEGRGHRVEAEGLPRLPDGGVVARVEDDRGARSVADGAGDLVHADVVVAVGDQQRPRSRPRDGSSQRRAPRRPTRPRRRTSCSGRRSRSRSRSAAGVWSVVRRRAPRGRAPRRATAPRDRGTPPAASSPAPRPPSLVVVPRLPPQRGRREQSPSPISRSRSLRRGEAARGGVVARPATRGRGGPVRPTHPDRRRRHHVAQGGAYLVDLALRLARDVGVALDQLVDRRGVGLAQRDVDADPATRRSGVRRAAPGRCAARRSRERRPSTASWVASTSVRLLPRKIVAPRPPTDSQTARATTAPTSCRARGLYPAESRG